MDADAGDPPRSPAEARAARLAADQARRRERLARKQEAVQEARTRHDNGATIAQLLPWWRERTELSRSTLYKAIHGVGDQPVGKADRRKDKPHPPDDGGLPSKT